MVDELLFVWEYYPPHHDNRYGTRHKLGLVFLCTLSGDTEPHMPDAPDAHQTAVRWLPLSQLENIPLLPRIGGRILAALRSPAENCFFAEKL